MKTFISLRSDFFRTCKLARSIMFSTLMGKKSQNMIVSWLIAVAFTLIADQGRACSLNYTGVDFGKYDFYNDAALLSSGNINMNCASGVGYIITLSTGNGPTSSVSWLAAHTYSTIISSPPLIAL